jgi:Stage II sporulation protein E (SpoIIE)
VGRSRRWSSLLLSALAISLAATAFPQALVSVHPDADSITHLRLGQSAFPLNGPWKFTVGDSPIDPKTGQPLWAEPGFDDSHWETVDLTPPEGSFEPLSGESGYVPGWTSNGHPGYWGYGWYRIRVQLDEARSGESLALEGPVNFDDAYQVFADGKLLGSYGDFSGKTPVASFSQPKLFMLAQPRGDTAATDSCGAMTSDLSGTDTDSRTCVVAFRLWVGPAGLVNEPDAGGMHSAPMLGDAGSVTSDYQLRRIALVQAYSSDVVLGLLFALLAVVAFSLILFDRTDGVYIWIGSVFLLTSIYHNSGWLAAWTQHLSVFQASLLRGSILPSVILAGWVMVWWIWFGREGPRWIPAVAAGLALASIVSQAIALELFSGILPHGAANDFEAVSLVVRLLVFALMLWIVIQGIRSQGIEGWLVLPAVLLRGVSTFVHELILMHTPLSMHPFGATITLGQIATILMALAVALLLLRRLLRSLEAQRELALDVKHAQEVQRVILPEAQISYPGLAIESVYRPAREVGGDFFQIIADPTDGSVLIVAGDVAGKGLQAGMLVALLIGAIRNQTETSVDPFLMLKSLNRRLMGRRVKGSAHAAATCLALRIARDGAVTLANSGHLPPYLNGQPLPMEGALPLGMLDSAEPSLMYFELKPDDRLILISDGILEAANSNGQLFGFDRIQALLASSVSAIQLADAAQSFGQNDDISVIWVRREAATIA